MTTEASDGKKTEPKNLKSVLPSEKSRFKFWPKFDESLFFVEKKRWLRKLNEAEDEPKLFRCKAESGRNTETADRADASSASASATCISVRRLRQQQSSKETVSVAPTKKMPRKFGRWRHRSNLTFVRETRFRVCSSKCSAGFFYSSEWKGFY